MVLVAPQANSGEPGCNGMRHSMKPRTFENYAHLVQPGREAGRGLPDAIARCSRCSDRPCGSLVTRLTRCADFSPHCTPCSRPDRQPRHSSEGWNPGSGAESRSQGWSGVSGFLSLQGERAGARVLRVGGCHAERSAAESRAWARSILSGARCRGIPCGCPAWPPRPLGEGDALARRVRAWRATAHLPGDAPIA